MEIFNFSKWCLLVKVKMLSKTEKAVYASVGTLRYLPYKGATIIIIYSNWSTQYKYIRGRGTYLKE